MSYENPQLPEGINVSRDPVLLEFLRLLAGLAVLVLAFSAVLYVAGGWLARQLPFALEKAWVGERPFDAWPGAAAPATGHAAVEAYLQTLAEQLAAPLQLPPAMPPRLHYLDAAEPNAFAGLGGHVAVTRGLYERMPSENALALVLAHELAHLRARDPIAAIGSGSTLVLVMALLSGDAGGLGTALAALVQRGYSRGAETRADTAAIAALRQQYGHAGGGAAVFEVLQRYRAEHGAEVPTLLSTHPFDEARIRRLRAAAAGWDPQRQPLRPLALPP